MQENDMDYHTPFLTGELAEDTGIRLDAAALDDEAAPVAAVDEHGNLLDAQEGRIPEIRHGE
jgi:hypothetical protein